MRETKITIPKDIIETINEYARSAYPNEFFAYLKGKISEDHISVDKVYYHPTLSSKNNVSILPSIETSDHGIIGTAHSHPNKVLCPSKADLLVFDKFPVNIITDKEKFRIFDNHGKEIHYHFVERKMSDNELDRIHANIFFEIIRERQKWASGYQNSIFSIIFAALILVIILMNTMQ